MKKIRLCIKFDILHTNLNIIKLWWISKNLLKNEKRQTFNSKTKHLLNIEYIITCTPTYTEDSTTNIILLEYISWDGNTWNYE